MKQLLERLIKMVDSMRTEFLIKKNLAVVNSQFAEIGACEILCLSLTKLQNEMSEDIIRSCKEKKEENSKLNEKYKVVKDELQRLENLYTEDLSFVKIYGEKKRGTMLCPQSYEQISGKLLALREIQTFILNCELADTN